jgi:hypothetical protein
VAGSGGVRQHEAVRCMGARGRRRTGCARAHTVRREGGSTWGVRDRAVRSGSGHGGSRWRGDRGCAEEGGAGVFSWLVALPR